MADTPALSASARDELMRAWRLSVGQELGDLSDDLTRLRDFFDPRFNAGNLLGRIKDVQPLEVRHVELAGTSPPLILQIGGRILVTPEGRLALERNRDIRGDAELLAPLYREWAMARAEELAADAAGRGDELWPAPMALVVALLATDAIGESNGWLLTEKNQAGVRDALRPVLVEMHERLGQLRGQPRTDFDNYPLSKARRRLGGDLRREPARRLPARIWLQDEQAADRAAQTVAFDLRRRRGLSHAASQSTIEQTIQVLSRQRGALQAQGIELVDSGRLRERFDRALSTVSSVG